eukprot:13923213-Alexandrium_andersonii.AAC.1
MRSRTSSAATGTDIGSRLARSHSGEEMQEEMSAKFKSCRSVLPLSSGSTTVGPVFLLQIVR